LTRNKVITNYGIKHFNLVKLILRNNQNITYDLIKKLINLKYLDISVNSIITDDGVSQMMNFIHHRSPEKLKVFRGQKICLIYEY
jgi:hypothetical protein